MTETSFRDLFVELPAALFETLKGIGEQAVAQEQERAAQRREQGELQATLMGRPVFWVTSFVCSVFGWSDVRVIRHAGERRTSLVARLACGHHTTYNIDEESLLAVTSPRDEVELLDRVVATTPRRCYCVTRR